MLYIKMDESGHYNHDEFFAATITPILSGKLLKNGAYDYGLAIKRETACYASTNLKIRSKKEEFVLDHPDKTVWILSQDSVIHWSNEHNSYYGHMKGGVIAHRLRETDVVIFQLPEDSWFVSGKTIYHNDGGVLVKYATDDIIGWETWNTIPHSFYDESAIKFRINGSYVKLRVSVG